MIKYFIIALIILIPVVLTLILPIIIEFVTTINDWINHGEE